MSYRKEFIINTFRELIFKETGNSIDRIENLRADASDRKIYRLFSKGKTLIGIFNENEKENLAFINFTGTFIKLGLNVPEIISVSDDNLFYIEEDLGDVTLYKFISESAEDDHIEPLQEVSVRSYRISDQSKRRDRLQLLLSDTEI